MTGFSADWLALRAPADARARDTGLRARLGAHFTGWDRLRVLDLGAGSGANLRATSGLIGAFQHWVLVDNDSALLARGAPVPNTTVELREVDLAAGVGGLFDPAPDLVTASAFFDLCGREWVDRLVATVTGCGAALYTVLTYDGREEWLPSHPLDAGVLSAFHTDQRRDKGLGPALGPVAHAYLAAHLKGCGYRVFEAASDWKLALPSDAALIAALADGASAAVGGPIGSEQAQTWRAARIAAHSVTIGHQDLLAFPPM